MAAIRGFIMGGCGSGRKTDRQVLEFAAKLNLSMLLRCRIPFDVPGSYHWQTTDSTGMVLYTSAVEVGTVNCGLRWFVRDTRQSIYLYSTTPHFGGSRWWFNCPGCERRCRILYKPAGRAVYECRICHHLRYADKSAASFGAMARLVNMDVARLKLAFDFEMRRNRKPFIRRRDRRPDYGSRRLTLLRATETNRH